MSAQVAPGQNVNMVSGRTWPTGDPFLQRQDEPSIAVSSRNVLHLVAGANDYRTVDLPGLPADKPTGDAWLGLFKSFDGGKTWQSNLIPGYPQDQSSVGLLSPLHGYDAGADPLVRAGANGLIFYSGIAFQRAAIVGAAPPNDQIGRFGKHARPSGPNDPEGNRTLHQSRSRRARGGRRSQPYSRIRGGIDDDHQSAGNNGTASTVFVSTLVDLNNREPGDPISYVRTTLVDRDPGRRFLDKQWMAVDVPRANAQMCVVDVPQPDGPPVRQSFPGGRIYVAYTAFSGSGATFRGQILFSYSTDCGATWSRPRDISSTPDPDVNDDGIVNAKDLLIVTASLGTTCGFSRFNPAADVDGDCDVDASDFAYVLLRLGKTYPTTHRIPQSASIAINPLSGAIYVTWREFKATGLPDAIQFAQSTNFGVSFSKPQTISTFYPYDQGTTGTSFRTSAFPAIASDGQRIYAAWSARNFAKVRQDPTLDDARIVMSTSTTGAAWTAPRVVDEPARPGHQIMPALTFGAGKLSLLYYDLREDVSLLFGPFVDELPILTSNPPGLRHTLDVRIAQASPADVPLFQSVQLSDYPVGAFTDNGTLQQLQFNPPNLPIFRQGTAPFIGDYIDLVTAPSIRANPDGTWSFNIEPSSAAAGHAVWTDNRDIRPGPNGDLSQYTPPNSASRGSVSLYDPTQPLAACNPDFTGTRDQNIYTARFDQGLFAAALQNSKELSETPRAFAVFIENAAADVRSYRLTIANQPPGGQASFEQFSLLTVLDVSIPPYSTVARMVHVSSTDPAARVTINVAQIAAPGGQVIVNGQQGSIVLNGDPTAPRLENASETYDPLLSSAIASPRIENPRLENPAIENPRIENVSTSNVGILYPRLENPAIENPRLENPRIENPAIENPRIENATIVNGTISDTTWELTNTGNTTAVYSVKLLLNQPVPTNFETQLVIHKTYTTPTAVGCDLKLTQRNVVVTNITTPAFATAADLANPRIENPRIENATVALAPGETANILLRVFDPDRTDAITFDAAAAVTPAAVAQAVNTDDAAAGVTQPPVAVAVSITTAFLAAVAPGGAYDQTLQANVPGTWSIAAGALPPGLTLNGMTGQITGTATTPGVYAFTIAFTDTASPPHTATHDYVIYVAAPLQIATTALLDGVRNVSYLDTVAVSGGVGTVTWAITAGALPPGLAIEQLTGRISGTPTAIGAFAFTVTASDQAQPNVPASRAYTIRVTDAVAEIDKTWVGGDTNWSNPANWSPAGVPGSQNNVVIPANTGTRPTLTQDSAVGSVQVAPGATLNLGGHTLRAFGSVDGGQTIVNGTLQIGGEGVSVAGTVPNLDVVGPVTFVDFLHVTGSLMLHGGPVSLLGTHHSIVDGSLTVPSGQASVPQILGGRGVLSVGGLNVDGLVLDSATLAVNAGPITRFDRVLFQNFDPTLTQLLIASAGAPAPFTFNQLIFTTTPTTGAYIDAFKRESADPFVINLIDAQATDGPAHTLTENGAVVNWTTSATADLAVTQFDAPDPVQVGGNVVYSISVTNNGPNTATNVTLTDVLPNVNGTPVVTFVSATASQGSCGASTGVVACALSDLIAGGTIDVSITVATTQAGSLSNGVSVTSAVVDPAPGNNASIVSTTVQAPPAVADLAVSKSHAPAQPVVGQSLTYSIVVQNNGPSNATGVVLTDTLPSGVTFVSASDQSCTQASGVVTCQIGALANGATRTVTVTVTPTAAQPLTNTASVSGAESDPNTANNSASDQAIVFAFPSCAAPTFSGPHNFAIGQSDTTWIANGDFNKDGKPDIAITRDSLNQVAVLLGDGAGGFGAPRYFGAGIEPAAIAIGDFNRDGNPDLAVLNFASANISILVGDGTGQFTPAATIAVPPQGTFLATADLNEDGNLDLLVGYLSGTTIAVVLGDGTGTFGTPLQVEAGPAPHNVIVRDFDRDGHLDVAVPHAGSDNAISILRGHGSGGFDAPHTITLPSLVARLRDLGDVNGDGKADLGVVTKPAGTGTPNNLLLLLNDSAGPGDFTFRAPSEVFPSSDNVGHALPADFNGDGRPDLVAISFATNSLVVRFGDGTGAFGAPMRFVFSSDMNSLVVDDFNGDGKPDVAGTQGTAGTFGLMLNTCGNASVADLSIAVAVNNTTLNIGDSDNGTVTITNHGPDPATGVMFIGTNSGRTGAFVITPSQGSCSGSGAAECSLGTIASNASATIDFSFVATSGGTTALQGSATANEADPNPADNYASVSVTINPGTGTYVVTNANDSGEGSLRQAILNSNSNLGFTNRITFNVAPGGPITIAPTSPLPNITAPVVIDGTTQPGFAGTPIVELSGAAAGAANGLNLRSGSSTVRGLVINRFAFSGINLAVGGGNVIEGSYIGTNLAGTAALPNGGSGVTVAATSSANQIGGSSAASRNVISGNTFSGVDVRGNGNTIQGNYIGTDASGSHAVGNNDGVFFADAARGNTVGGVGAQAGNVISGNRLSGVKIMSLTAGVAGATQTTVVGNAIGVNAVRTAALPNVGNGVFIQDAPLNTIGGANPGARNLISGNGAYGVRILGSASTGNLVRGNFIGTTADGVGALSNTAGGVQVQDASNNAIGGLGTGEGNVIAFNGGSGVLVATGIGDSVRGNSITANAALGIDLGSDGVTPNDLGDGDTGANNRQNFPALTSATVTGGTVSIAGTLNSIANAAFALDFYGSAACDSSGFGEGATFLGSTAVTTDAGGNVTFGASFPFVAGQGVITATATDASGNTSEFSQCRTAVVQTTADLSITKNHASTPNPALEQSLTYTIAVTNGGPDAAANTVVTDTLPASVAFGSATSTIGSCTQANGTVTCSLGTLASGGSATITLVVTPQAAGPLTNTASVSASASDPNAANNSASDVAMVVFGPCAAPSFYGPDNTTVSTVGTTTVALADFNHDGLTDGAATESSLNQIVIVLGQNGPDIITHVAVGTNPIVVVTADFNNDGNADLAVTNQGSGTVSVLLGNGQGGFAAPVNTAVAGAFGLVAADLNKDGFVDLVVGPNTGTTVSALLWNPATGGFNAPVAFAVGGTSPTLVVADFDGDGQLDVIAANRGANTVGFLKGDGLGGFAQPVSIAIGAPVVAVRAVGDANGDGRPDLGVTTGNGQPTNTNLLLLLNAGNGSFGAPSEILAPSMGVIFAAPGDFNGDGRSDLAVTSSATGSALVLLGNGDGTYNAPVSYVIGSNPSHIVVYDVDQDGRPDIVGTRGGNGDVWVLQNLCGSASSADLTLTASVTSPVLAGQLGTLTFTVTNSSATTPATNVIVSAALPGGISFSPQTGDAPFCAQRGATLSCTPPDIPASGSATFHVSLFMIGAGTKSIIASATAFEIDPNPADNTATATTTITGNALTLTVTNTNDSGIGSLRAVLGLANGNTGAPSPNRINFNIPGTGPFTITPLTALPTITSPVIIDATTQPGFAGTPIIELSGATAGASGANGLRISAGSSIVRGLVINRWRGAGIQLDTAGASSIVGNYIGTDVAGSAGIVNARDISNGAVTVNPFGNGVGVRVQSPNNVIGGTTASDRNVISGNSSAGVDIRNDAATGLSGSGSTVSGNYIGTNAAGTAINPNGSTLNDNGVPFSAQGAGIQVIGSPNVTIGGATSSAGNVISGNTNGIDASGPNTIIQNNLIGTNASATAILRFTTGSFTGDWTEGGDGIFVGTNTTVGPGNVIAGHINSGIVVSGFGASTGTGTIFGNFIGTNANGSAGLGNRDGINIVGGSGIVVGGAAGRNVISGNSNGISLLVNAGTPASNNQISNNYIGVTPGGGARLANGTGVRIVGGVNNTIGGTTAGAGNVISGNGIGVLISTAANGNVVQGNLIGTTASGVVAMPNSSTAVSIDNSSNNTIGGTTAAARNIISGNSGTGVQISGTGATNNRVQGNYIGTDIAGTSPLPNTLLQSGINVNNGASNNVIGGSVAGAGNVVSGNAQHAITIFGATTSGNIVQGNFVGVDASGNVRLANGGIGLDIVSAPNTVVGGTGLARNVISGNGVGIQIRTGATGTIVQNNYLGVAANGTTPIGNTGNGVQIIDASGNTIGGTGTGQGNVIIGNGVGVNVTGATSVGNAIRGNSIDGSGFLGIDLNSDGVTANDTGDVDAGPNNLQNFPVVTQANVSGGSVSVAGALNSAPSGTYAIDFFASAACDASGNGEGAVFLGSLQVVTDAAGNATFNSGLPFTGVSGFITATATDAAGNTSEFSACRATTAGAADLVLSIADAPDPVVQGTNVTYTYSIVNNGPSPATNVTLVGSFGPGLTFVAATNGCVFGSPCNLGTVVPGSPVVVAVTMRADAPGSTFASATVSSDIADPNAADNSDSEPTTVVGAGPQTFVVTNTNDGGAGSLRQAVVDANANAGADTITFTIPGSGVRTITLTTPLPAITETVTIDGTSQPGWAGTPVVELNGTSAGASADGLFINGAGAAGTQVIGLAINRFGAGGAGPDAPGGAGIVVQSAPNVLISQNVIGLDPAGATSRGNRSDGVFIDAASGSPLGFVVATNVISGNGRNGITVSGASANGVIAGNRIGTNGAGQAPLGNGSDGVSIVGVTSGTGLTSNVISGNRRYGVRVLANSSQNTIYANMIGADVAGTGAVPNGAGGIVVENSTLTVIGQSGGGNTIAFNHGNGVSINSGTQNFINANSIFSNGGLGIDLAPTGALAAQVLDFEDRPDSIAGPAAFPTSYQGITWTNWLEVEPVGPRGYVQDGANSIFAAVSGARFTFPLRTFLGARFSRSSAVFSPGAVYFELYRQGALVATSPVLADNAPPLTFLPSGYQGQVDEVRVISLGSSMTGGGAAWIMDDVLFGNGVTPNDADDSDAGANNLQNFPVISSATSSGGTITIPATLTSTPNTGFTVEFFSTPSCDASGIGQGMTYIGTTTLAGNQSGTMTINAVFGVAIPAGRYITATATDAFGNTSEFSPCVQVTSNGRPTANAGPDQTLGVGATAQLNGTGSSDPENSPLTYAWSFVSRPAGSAAVLAGASTATPSFVIDVAGDYVVQLIVNDGQLDSAPDTVVIGTPATLALSPSGLSVNPGSTGSLTVSIPSPRAANIQVALSSSDTTTATVPPSVAIPAGQTSAAFNVTAANVTGSATISASAAGTNTAKAVVAVNTRLVQWNVDASGSWDTASNWTGNAVPGNGDTVVIDRPAGNFVVTVPSTTATIGSLYAIESLTVSGTLNVSGSVAINGGLTLSGALAGAGRITVDGPMTWTSGTVAVAGGLEIGLGRTLTLSTTSTKVLSGTALRTHGTVNWADGAIVVQGGTTVTVVNEADGLWQVQGDLVYSSNGCGTLTFANAGTLVKTAGSGAFQLAGCVAYSNSGTIEVQGGTVQVASASGLANSGHLTVGGGTTFELNNVTLASGSTFSGTGTLLMNGTTTVTGDVTLPVPTAVSGTVQGAGALHTAAPMTWTSGTVAVSGGLEIGLGRTLTLSTTSTKVLSGTALRTHGTVTWTAGAIVLQGGTTVAVVNESDGTWDFQGDQIFSTNGCGNLNFTNAGTLGNSGAVGTLTIGGCLPFSNTGTIQLRLGGRTAGQFDRIVSSYQAALGGTLDILLVNGFTPIAGDTFAVLDYASRSGVFATITGHTQTYTPTYGATTLTLTDTTVPSGPQNFVVTNTNDSGAGSLRQAILDANANAGQADTIAFDIPGSGVHTITLASALPTVADPVTIDGSTQPGFAGTPLVEISGLSTGASANGLTIGTTNSTIRSLAINRFAGVGVIVAGAGNALEGNFVGINSAGTAAAPNGLGVMISNGSSNRIGGTTAAARNVVSGNGSYGVFVTGTSASNVIVGNVIGTDASGAADVGNQGAGILISGAVSGGSVGGSGPAANRIAFNHGAGILLAPNRANVSPSGITISGNSIHSNAGLGIELSGGEPITVVDFEDQPDSIAFPGVAFPTSYQNITWENWRQYAPYGSPYQPHGVNAIFAAVDGARFTFAAQPFAGAWFSRLSGATGAVFFELYQNGSLVATSAPLLSTDESFTFVPSGYSGVVDEVRVRALGSSMTPAGSPWIMDDVTFGSSVTPNDSDDSDAGPNGLQNYPQLTSATLLNGVARVAATLTAKPNTAYTVEFFSNAACDLTGFGEGATHVATSTLGGNPSGVMTFTAVLTAGLQVGQFVTATARETLSGDTSEFSNCIVVAQGSATIDLAPATLNLLTRDTGTLTANFNTAVDEGGTTIVTSNDNPAVATVQTNVAVQAGSTSASLAVSTGSTAGTAHILASSNEFGSGAGSQIVVSARTMTLAPASSFVGVGKTINGTLTLTNPAPGGGATIALTSSNPSSVTISPAFVDIPAGDISASFTLTGVAEGQATLNASSPGYVTAVTSVTGSANQGFAQSTISFFNPAPIPAPNGASDRLAGAVVSFFNPAPVPAPNGAADRLAGAVVSFFNPAPIPAPSGASDRFAGAVVSFLNPAPIPAPGGATDGMANAAVSFFNPASIPAPGGSSDRLATGTVSFASGPAILGVSPPQLSRAVAGAQTLTITGVNLRGTTVVVLNPSTGITVGAPSVSPDGTILTVNITLIPSTPTGMVNVAASGASGTTPTTAVSRFEVVP